MPCEVLLRTEILRHSSGIELQMRTLTIAKKTRQINKTGLICEHFKGGVDLTCAEVHIYNHLLNSILFLTHGFLIHCDVERGIGRLKLFFVRLLPWVLT